MTDSKHLFFDTDCISAFLWVREESLVEKLYSGKIIIPQSVYSELSNPKIFHLKARLDLLISRGSAEVIDIDVNTDEYDSYYKLTNQAEKGKMIIGKGEAAALVLARKENGIVASNNLNDINDYISEWKLEHTTTADILVEANKQGLITEDEGNIIWANMLSKRRKLGANSFSDYIRK